MTEYKKHLYYCLAEECAEVIQEVTKTLRFGEDDYSPYDPTCTKNRERIRRELIDLLAVMEMCDFYIDTRDRRIGEAMTSKMVKVNELFKQNGGVFE